MIAAEKVAIVTGASRGIGAGIVRQFLARGYRVVACSRKIANTGQPNLVEVAGDISQPETAALVVQTAKERFGRVDTLINNAGAFLPKSFTEYTENEFAALLQVNLGGFFHVSQRAIAEMLHRASGHIVNITSSLAGRAAIEGPAGGFDGDHQGRGQRRDAVPRYRICGQRYSGECGGSRGDPHSDACDRYACFPCDHASNGSHRGNSGNRRCGSLSRRCGLCHRRDFARRWRGSRRAVVTQSRSPIS